MICRVLPPLLQHKWILFMFRLVSEFIPIWGDLMRWPAVVLSNTNYPVILSNLPLCSRQLYKLLPALIYLYLITTMLTLSAWYCKSTNLSLISIHIFFIIFNAQIYHNFQKLNYILGIILNVRCWNYSNKTSTLVNNLVQKVKINSANWHYT